MWRKWQRPGERPTCTAASEVRPAPPEREIDAHGRRAGAPGYWDPSGNWTFEVEDGEGHSRSCATRRLDDGQLDSLISGMAEHTKNLERDPRAALMVAENGAADPLANGRHACGTVHVAKTMDVRLSPRSWPRIDAATASAGFASGRLRVNASGISGDKEDGARATFIERAGGVGVNRADAGGAAPITFEHGGRVLRTRRPERKRDQVKKSASPRIVRAPHDGVSYLQAAPRRVGGPEGRHEAHGQSDERSAGE